MKKFFILFAMLVAFASFAKADVIEVSCHGGVQTRFYAEDNDLFITMSSNGYVFYFDVVCAQGATDIVDGQTYTLTDMSVNYSFFEDYNLSSYVNYVSVSLVRTNGDYDVNVTDEYGRQFHITTSASVVITAPTDTVVVDMTTNPKNRAFDLISSMGVIQLIGFSNDGYLMNVVFYADQFAGSYTLEDRYEDDLYFMLYSDFDPSTEAGTQIKCNNILEATVTGTALNCTAHIKWVAADSTMYDISFAYADPTVQSQQTFTATDLTITEDYMSDWYVEYVGCYVFGFQASNGTQILSGKLYPTAKSPLGTWNMSDGDIEFNLYDAITGEPTSEPFNGTITIAQAQDGSYTLTGTSLFYNNVEWTFNCSFVIVPEDTVAIVMDNEEVNMVYDHTTDGEDYFTLYGADQNVEYLFQLGVYASGQMAGTYTQNDVALEATTLIHFTETATTVEIAEVRDFTVLGDSTGCSTYIEILSTDLVLYKITYTYGNAPEPPVAVEDVNAPEFVVVSENSAIVVYGVEGQTMAVYDMAGRTIMNGKSTSDIERIDVAVPGIYVVRIADKAVKVVVK